MKTASYYPTPKLEYQQFVFLIPLLFTAYIYIWTIYQLMLPVIPFLKKAMILCKVLDGLIFSFHIIQQKFIHVVVFSYRLFIFMVITNPLCVRTTQISHQTTLWTQRHTASLLWLKLFPDVFFQIMRWQKCWS